MDFEALADKVGGRIDATLDLFTRDMRDVAHDLATSVKGLRELSRPLWYVEVMNGVADGSGDGRLTFGGPNLGTYWLVDRISVGAAGAATAAVYVGSVEPGNLVDFTNAAAQNVSDLESPIYVPAGNPLIIVFDNVTANAPIAARIQARIIPELR